ncbi:15376_t:CDS:1, partial [Gigaspora rosea]
YKAKVKRQKKKYEMLNYLTSNMEIEQNTPIQEDVVMEDSIPFPEPIMQPPLIDDRDKKKQRLDKPLPPPTTTATKNGDSSLPPSVTAALSPEQTVGIITVNTQSILYENQEPPQGKPVSPQTDQQLKIEMEIEPTQTNIPPKIVIQGQVIPTIMTIIP